MHQIFFKFYQVPGSFLQPARRREVHSPIMATDTKPPPEQLPPQPPSPSPSIIDQIISLDEHWSLHLHTIAAPMIPRFILKLLEHTGDGRFWFPFAISLFLSPLSLHSLHLYRFFLSLLLGLVFDIIVIGLIKYLVRRPRPVYNKGMTLTVSVDRWSFPSGHSSRVCFTAAFMYLSAVDIVKGLEQLKMRKGEFIDRWIGGSGDDDVGNIVRFLVFFVCIWSVLTSVSRVFLGRHFVFDVLVGACLGVFEALFVYMFIRF